MGRPTSFRLPQELLDRLEEEGRSLNTSVTSVVTTLLDEGLKTRRFPGVVYREGPAGRRAGLLGGPDVWEVVRDLRRTPGKGMKRVERLAADLGLPVARVRLASEFYVAFPAEIDRLVADDEAAATRARRIVDERERLLSG